MGDWLGVMGDEVMGNKVTSSPHYLILRLFCSYQLYGHYNQGRQQSTSPDLNQECGPVEESECFDGEEGETMQKDRTDSKFQERTPFHATV